MKFLAAAASLTAAVASASAVRDDTCSSVAEAARLDCYPAEGASQDACESRGCCWAEASGDSAAPWCFFPDADSSVGYAVGDDGSTLQRTADPSPYGGDIATASWQLEEQTNERLHFKLGDASQARYEVPIPIFDSSDSSSAPADAPLFTTKTAAAGAPFSLSVTRAATGSTVLDTGNAPLQLSDQFLEMSFALPAGATVYGLGEHVADLALPMDDFSRVPLFARDQATPTGTQYNLYGTHPLAVVVEPDGNAFGLFFRNSNAMEVVLRPEPGLTFRTIGGVLDFYVVMGPTPDNVVEQYTALVGLPAMMPRWAMGFHLCRWGYNSQENTTLAYEGMIEAGIPMDVQWNDIDYMDQHLDFTTDPVNFPDLGGMAADLHSRGMRYVQIVDPGIANFLAPGEYTPYDEGHEADIFIKHANGDELVGVVWPGNTTFPDFLNPAGVDYWVEQFTAYQAALDGALDGIWTDMNEPISMGPDGSTVGCPPNQWDQPPYTPAVTDGVLNSRTLCMNSEQYYNGSTTQHYNVHSLYGMSEVIATRQAMQKMNPGKRPFVLTRSSFAGEGHYGAHWLGDNTATWDDIKLGLPGILNFNMFGVPMVGPDIGGFNDPSTPELVARWQEVGAFHPFSRNHNSIDMPGQAPFELGETVANASRNALATRYELMPTLYSLFHRAHAVGTPVARALAFQHPEDPNTRAIDKQFMWGSYLLVTPALDEGVDSVTGYFPPASRWFDWYTGEELQAGDDGQATLPAPLGQVPLHLRGGSVVATAAPGSTTTAQAPQPTGLHAALDADGAAEGFVFYDDDEGDNANTLEDGLYYSFAFSVADSALTTTVVHKHEGQAPPTGFAWSDLRVCGLSSASVSGVAVDGADLDAGDFSFENGVLTVNMKAAKVAFTDEHTVTWS